MPETFANEFTTALDGSITDTVTSLTVLHTPPTGLTGNFRIRIDNEFMLVTAIGGTGNKDWTVTREAEEASRFPAGAHSDGALVAHVLTSGALAKALEGFYGLGKDNSVITISSGNTPVDIATKTLTAAPAGVYFCFGRYYVNGAGTSNVWLEAQSNGGGYSQLKRSDCRTITGERINMEFYTHTGGDLDVRLRGYYESSNATLGLAGDDRWGRELAVFSVNNWG